MLDRGVLPSSKIEEKTIGGKRVFFVAGNYLVACFNATLDEAIITTIAKMNLEQLLKTYNLTMEWWVI